MVSSGAQADLCGSCPKVGQSAGLKRSGGKPQKSGADCLWEKFSHSWAMFVSRPSTEYKRSNISIYTSSHSNVMIVSRRANFPADKLLLFAAVLAGAGRLPAHDIITTNLTFSRDVSRIFLNRCVVCHDSQSSIPLTNYAEVRPWAVAIKDQVLARTMPPWGAVKGFGNLMPDGGLNQEEITIIAAWVIGGAPQGDPALLQAKTLTLPGAVTQSVRDALTVDTRKELQYEILAAGIRPLSNTSVKSTKVLAKLPDGRVIPVLWLFQFDPKWARTFTFRTPVELPSGTVVESSSPLRFAVEQRIATKLVPGS